MPDDNNASPAFRFATASDIHAIVALDRRYLPADTVIGEDVFARWRTRNRRTFTALLVDGALRGYFSLLPLRGRTLARFVAGEIAERDFVADDILTESDTSAPAASLYFYSIVLDEAARSQLPVALRELAAQLRHYSRRQVVERVYATAATPSGRRLLERIGFQFATSGERRADAHDLYTIEGEPLDRLIHDEALTT